MLPHDDPLAVYDLALRADDEPQAWTAQLRTGLVMLAAEHQANPHHGIKVLTTLFPQGPSSAGLTEQDLWARLLLRAGQAREALEAARARQQIRDSTIPRLLQIEATLALGELDEAGALAGGMAEVAGAGSVAPALARANVALAAGDLAAAEDAYREALALRPDHVQALRGLARVAEARGDVHEAAGMLRDAAGVAGGEERPGVLRELLALMAQIGDTAHAEALEEERVRSLRALAERLRERLLEARSEPRTGAGRRARSGPGGRAATAPSTGPSLLERAKTAADEVPPDELVRALFLHFGHTDFRPGQAAVLRSVLTEGRDTLALMPTGSGKSLTFQLPAALLPGVVLVVSPLLALMADQIAGLAQTPELAGRATVINSTLAPDELEERLAALAAGAYSLVYVAPERLRQAAMRRALRRAGVSLLVIDEAHCLCLWGHAFRPEYLAVGGLAEALAVPRVLAVTATATPAMQEEIARTIGRPLRVVSTGVLRENLFLEVRQLGTNAEKLAALIGFARGTRGSGIVYATSRESCERLARELRHHGVQAAHYHAGMGSQERAEVQAAFMGGRMRVLVATVAFGMGVNKRDVRFIVHYNPARSLEAYTQEAGRAGRDGQPAHCLLLTTSADKATLTRHAREDRLDQEALRALYRAVRAAVRDGDGGPVDPGLLAIGGDDPKAAETAARVGLSALERAGFLRRGLDCPRDFMLRLAEGGADPRLADLSRALGLRPGAARVVTAAALATALGVEVDAVEDLLAGWQEAGLLAYRPGRRGLLLAVVEPPPADGAQRLAELLAAYEAAAEGRARALARYIDSGRCRNLFIAGHFGEPASGACGRCDNCRPEGRRTAAPAARPRAAKRPSSMAPREAIVRLLAELPFNVGRSGLVRILRGQESSPIGPDRCRLHGALAGTGQAAILQEVELLVEEGLLETVARDGYALLALTAAGTAALGGEEG